ncbi:MAG: energy-coupling factor transporter transmembrane protein EcfT [Bacteroidales bacterium]|nr:energy-coupling factor transporter transmembrane protein EcfT [Bacteroidales bacterium]
MCKESHAIHPILSLVYSLLLFVMGLLFVKQVWFWLYLITFLILFLLFRFEKIIIKTIPFILIFGLIMAGLTIINGNKSDVLYAFYRVLALGLASILSISIKPINLVRAFNQLNIPRWISLGLLIVIRFIQIFREEMRQIRQAITLRGIRFIETPILWGRAFFIPLIIRVLSISEGLAISLETRGFSTEVDGSSFEIICFKRRDLVFSCIFIACLTFYIYLFFRRF